jgi:hypothetical protein
MPKEKKVGKFVEIPPDVVAAVQALAERMGTTFTFELIDALKRHVAYPPARVPEPLPCEARPAKPRSRRKK